MGWQIWKKIQQIKHVSSNQRTCSKGFKCGSISITDLNHVLANIHALYLLLANPSQLPYSRVTHRWVLFLCYPIFMIIIKRMED